jgi:ADP-heptose:LPS heptosyltransferase
MGDVALTLPVIRSVIEQNPELEIVFVSRKFFEPIFNGIDRFQFYGIDVNEYKGLQGLWKLCNELDKLGDFDYFVDLHDSLRTKIMRSVFRLWRVKNSVIDKGKQQRKILTRKKSKKIVPLKHITERYADVFKNSGINCSLESSVLKKINVNKESRDRASIFYKSIKQIKYLGFAPFSAHQLKEWDLENVEKFLQIFIQNNPDYHILLFGAKNEFEKLKELKANNEKMSIVSGLEGGFETELAVIERLDYMISMDSANMHLAALLGVKVLAIFGPTHPYLGWGPYLQGENVVQLNDLECRPCSVFGSNNCHRGDHACMKNLFPDMVLNRIKV